MASLAVAACAPAAASGAVAWKSQQVFEGAKVPGTLGGTLSDIATGDVTGDSLTDIIIAEGAAQQVVVVPAVGPGQFGSPVPTPVGPAESPRRVTSGDLNSDGRTDVIVEMFSQSSASVISMLGTPSGAFASRQTITSGGSFAALLDVNGDTHLDIAVGTSQIELGTGKGDGSFDFPAALRFPYRNLGQTQVAVGNLDGGLEDLAVWSLDRAAPHPGSVLTLLTNNGGGYTKSEHTSPFLAGGITMVDLNGDGFDELLRAEQGLTQSGSLLPPPAGEIDGFTFSPATGLAPGGTVLADGNVTDLARGDFDLPPDGREDAIAITNGVRDSFPTGGRQPSLVNWIHNTSAGPVVRPVTAEGPSGNAIAAGELNGDGVLDFVVSRGSGNGGTVLAYTSFDDVVPPETQFESASTTTSRADRTPRRAVKIRFKSNEPGSAFKCRIDGGKSQPCRSPLRPRDLSRGDHVIAVRARDLAGNSERKPARRKFHVGR
ncbi:MAG: FG-GAP repeat domain-containing protein [Solirubrobacterales bacterium]